MALESQNTDSSAMLLLRHHSDQGFVHLTISKYCTLTLTATSFRSATWKAIIHISKIFSTTRAFNTISLLISGGSTLSLYRSRLCPFNIFQPRHMHGDNLSKIVLDQPPSSIFANNYRYLILTSSIYLSYNILIDDKGGIHMGLGFGGGRNGFGGSGCIIIIIILLLFFCCNDECSSSC